jgi:hypothetical protein
VLHILNPHRYRGGFLQFIYQHCETQQNPFGQTPIVTGFLNFPDAAAFLAASDGVYYLADDAVFTVQDIPYYADLPDELSTVGYNRRKHRIVASIIEGSHTARYQGLVDEDQRLKPEPRDIVLSFLDSEKSVLIFADHASIAEAVMRSMPPWPYPAALVTGTTHKALKQAAIEEFRNGNLKVLIGTATLATGTDGLDKACDTLLILDDTHDGSLRRQLIGRILPRGDMNLSAGAKKIFRMVPK